MDKTGRFPFADAPDTAAFVCVHVLNGERPVMLVSHDQDGYWQFLCGKGHTEEDARIVSLQEAYMLDTDTGKLAGLDCGRTAVRENAGSEWTVL